MFVDKIPINNMKIFFNNLLFVTLNNQTDQICLFFFSLVSGECFIICISPCFC